MTELTMCVSDESFVSVRINNDESLFNDIVKTMPDCGTTNKDDKLCVQTWRDYYISTFDVLNQFDVSHDFALAFEHTLHQGIYIFNDAGIGKVKMVEPTLGFTVDLTSVITNDLLNGEKLQGDNLILLVALKNNQVSIKEFDEIMSEITGRKRVVILDHGYTFILTIVSLDNQSN